MSIGSRMKEISVSVVPLILHETERVFLLTRIGLTLLYPHTLEAIVEPNALIPSLLAHSNYLLSLWVVHLLASFALILILAARPTLRADALAMRFVLLAYIGFAITHLMCMQWVLKQWGVLAELLRDRLTPDQLLKMTGSGLTEAPDFIWVVPFHVLADAFVITAIRKLSKNAV